MTTPSEVRDLIGEAGQAMGALYGPVYRGAIEAAGFDLNTPHWFLLVVSLDFEPETTTAARFAAHSPYNDPRRFEDGLAVLAGRGLLEPVSDGEYRITEQGHATLKPPLDAFNEALAELEPLPAGDLERIITLMGRVVEAALVAPEPAAKPILKYNRSSDPGPDGVILMRFAQYAADLNSFRDDAHLAAWQRYNVSGQMWEAFSFVWEGEATTAEKILEERPNRGYTADDYAAVLDDLVAKGWIEKTADGTYAATEQGKALRQEAEDLTDRYYYAAWDALSAAEVDELAGLLVQLRDRLKEMAPETT